MSRRSFAPAIPPFRGMWWIWPFPPPNRFEWGINLTHIKHLKVFREITGFRNPQSYERLDNISVAEWVANDFPMGLYDLYFLPFAKSSLNAPDVLSAGELMQFFHFYFFRQS